MAIIKPPKKQDSAAVSAAAEAFISGAPDSAAAAPAAPRRVRKGNRVQISLTIPEDTLERVDELASQIGQSRAGTINLAITQLLQSGLRIEG